MCDVCTGTRRAVSAAAGQTAAAPPLPADVGEAIVTAVAGLRWPVGRRSLVAMLRGSVEAPPSARRSPAFGTLARASEADVRRWLGLLLAAGALADVETDDGFRVVVAVAGAETPVIEQPGADAPGAAPVVERLRAWRLERSRADGVPAYVVLHDATLRELAATRPGSLAELAAVKGFGPTKLDRYGEAVLEVVAR